MLTFNKRYFILTILLFVIEVLIALYIKDRIIRPYVGDILVVMLIYCFVRSFVNGPVLPLALSVLLFAFTIEFLQYIRIVDKLGLQKSKVASTVIGTSFSWIDVVCYAIGVVVILIVELLMRQRKEN
jgi:hypothetical protein